MTKSFRTALATIALAGATVPLAPAQSDWTSLFNGRDLTGWKVNENPQTFSVHDGAIVAHGPRSHCFYVGTVHTHEFRDFELSVEVMTLPGSNGGIYFDAAFQPQGWPGTGFEAQVNNSYKGDPRLTGSLYEVADNHEPVAQDNRWFNETITAKGDTVTIRVDGKVTAQWTQPSDWNGTKDFRGRRIGPGTIALQGHDPGSTVYYKNIRIRLLAQ